MLKIETMKKIYILLAALVVMAGCDDGDMTFKALNFEDYSAPARCGTDSNTIYLTNGSEALIMTLPPAVFLNVASPKDAAGNYVPTAVMVGGSSQYTMYYRNYSGTVSSPALCQSSGTPTLLEQWTANGRLLITTTENRAPTTNKLTGYSHQIVIESATLSKGEQEVTIVNNLLGSFTTTVNIDFGFDTLVTGEQSVPRRCSSGKQYKINYARTTETLELQIPSSYFTGTGPQSIDLINNAAGDIFLYFNVYERPVSALDVCATDTNNLPNRTQSWLVRSGKIEINYVPASNQYIISFRNLVFYNNATNASAETFVPLDNTSEAGVYWFGPYVP